MHSHGPESSILGELAGDVLETPERHGIVEQRSADVCKGVGPTCEFADRPVF